MCYERQSKLDRRSRREFQLILAAIVRHQEQPDFDPTERFYRPPHFHDGAESRFFAPQSDDQRSDGQNHVETSQEAPTGYFGQSETLLEMVSRVSAR